MANEDLVTFIYFLIQWIVLPAIILTVFITLYVRTSKRARLYRPLDRKNYSNSSEIIQTMQMVARQRDKKAIPYLLTWLGHTDPSLAVNAAQALQATGWQPNSDELALRFDFLLQNRAAVVTKGETAVTLLTKWLKEGQQATAFVQ